MIKNIFLLILLSVPSWDLLSQDRGIYSIKETYNRGSYDLIERIKAEGQTYIDPLPKSNSHIADYIQEMVDWHVDMVQDKYFIKDPMLESYLEDLVDDLLEGTTVSRPFKVLVAKNFQTNAYTTGIGAFIINIGLLARLESEEQLAFVLAHEIAHWELEHIRKKIIHTMESKERIQASREVRKLGRDYGRISLEGIKRIREWMQLSSGFSREMETEADSLGYQLYCRLYGKKSEPMRVMQLFDSAFEYSPYLGSSIFRALSFRSTPFNSDWVKNDQRDFFIAQGIVREELRTHPHLEVRAENLSNMRGNCGQKAVNPSIYVQLKQEAEMENIQIAYELEDYSDFALYFALRQKAMDPNNSYVNGMIGKILYTAAQKKKNGMLLISSDTTNYAKELYYVNAFLYNAEHRELSDMAFAFMKQKGNFDRRNEDHYILLYDICAEVKKAEMQAVVKQHYLTAFPNGKYVDRMLGL